MHIVFYLIHMVGMATLLLTSLILLLYKKNESGKIKRYTTILLSAAHTQLLTGFILFFIMLSEINHLKIGIKMLLAVVIAVLSTMYKRKVSQNQTPNSLLLLSILIIGFLITVIAFYL